MSRNLALIAAVAMLELAVCTTASISENSSSDMPANTESISETAQAEKPARLIEKDGDEESASDSSESTGKSAESKPARKRGYKAATPIAAEADDEEEESLLKKKEFPDDKEVAANAYMSQDDSNPGSREKDPVLYYQAGCRFMKVKRYQQALDSFNKALELNPKYYEASFRKALVYHLTGYDKYAARRYQDVIKHKPEMSEARINLAALHRKHKHYSGAEEQLLAVIETNPYSFEAHYNLANVLVEDGRPEEALKEYKLCLKIKPKNAMVHNNMGVLFLQRNYPDEALQEFKAAARLSPGNQTFMKNIQTAQGLVAAKKAKGANM